VALPCREVGGAVPNPFNGVPQFADANGGAHRFQGMDYRERITTEAGKRSGKPRIRGLRITVDDVLSYLAAGMSEDEILVDCPSLERDDFRAVYAFAADRERRRLTDPAA
jgi:uncharacterized protein (DUF433 family)